MTQLADWAVRDAIRRGCLREILGSFARPRDTASLFAVHAPDPGKDRLRRTFLTLLEQAARLILPAEFRQEVFRNLPARGGGSLWRLRSRSRMMKTLREGGCQCGAVRYRIEGDPIAVFVCHCSECQRQSGSAFAMTLMIQRAAFQLLSGSLKDFTRVSESGREIRCAFCPECGTRIHHEPKYRGGVLNVKPGTLDDTSWLRPTSHFWTLRRQPWVEIPSDARCFERQPI